ncbi:MAG: hypothetical protein Q8M66_07930, partial [Actinomycetota bacterium]|nr:hypothetical protein [Actinomycetota bacterium]
PVRLVVSMPARRLIGQRVAAAGIASALLVSIAAFLALEPVIALPLVAIALLFALQCGRALVRPWVREQLEVDARFVTLAYDGEYAAIQGRSQFIDPRVQFEPRTRLESPGFSRHLWPLIVWGDRGSVVGGVGSGLSKQDAAQVLAAIERFCVEHPVDSGFDFGGSYLLDSQARV